MYLICMSMYCSMILIKLILRYICDISITDIVDLEISF